MDGHPFGCRAVQLDLARQKESPEAVSRFIRFASEWGFNTLFLYLEGAVRTPSFPQRAREKAYEAGEIAEIVAQATAVGMEVIPGLATLGHAGHFMEHPELRPLDELAPEGVSNTFCPSRPGTHAFLEAYVSEVAALFPSRNVHVGCDEVWALAQCPVCRERGREGVFLDHLLRMHRLLLRLGKRMWIWSDMLESLPPGALEQIPKDVVLCEWQYVAAHLGYDGVAGHFNNLARRDALALYERSGHESLLCCGGEWSNGQCDWAGPLEMTEMGRGRPGVLGGLVTHWKMTTTFLPGLEPTVAWVGHWWSHPGASAAAAREEMFARLFPHATVGERLAIAHTYSGPLWRARLEEVAHRGVLTQEERRYLEAALGHGGLLAGYLARLGPGAERDRVEEIHTRVRLQAVLGQLREAFARLAEPRASESEAGWARRQGGEALVELASLARERAGQWERWRPGIGPDAASASLEALYGELGALYDRLIATPPQSRGLLSLRLFLIEAYSSPRLEVELEDASGWHRVAHGIYRPVNYRDAAYLLEVPLFGTEGAPRGLRITVSGYGGLGVSFAQVVLGRKRWVPLAIRAAGGILENREAVLRDDAFPTYLGKKETLKTLEAGSAAEKTFIEMNLHCE